MTEDEARAWLESRVPRETMEQAARLVSLVIDEAERQNLVSASTIPAIWSRHVVDSAQLIDLAPGAGRWVDLGSGAGFPGIVVAMMSDRPVVLAESRTKRIAFLRHLIEALDLGRQVSIAPGRIELMPADRFDIVSARAFAPLDRLFETAIHLADAATTWILPKGRNAQAELDAARISWQGSFRVDPSVTDPDAAIIVADNVRARGGRRRAGSMT